MNFLAAFSKYTLGIGSLLLIMFVATGSSSALAGSQVCKTTSSSVYDACCSQPQVYNSCCSSYTQRYPCGSTYIPPTCQTISVCTPIKWVSGNWTCEWLGETRTICSGGGYRTEYCTEEVCRGCYQTGPCQGCYRTQSTQTCNLLPDPPTLLAPNDWGTAIGDASLMWSGNDPDRGPSSMQFQIIIRSGDGQFQKVVNFGTGPTSTSGQTVSYYFNPEMSGTFFWKVRAWDGYQDETGQPVYSDYSQERVLVVDYNCGL